MRIVFMGTPDFAAVSLKRLIKSNYNIIGIYTQPDRPKGRGKQTQSSPVKSVGEKNEIPIFQPKSLRSNKEIEKFKLLKPDLCVVVAYGQILPEGIINAPRLGCINIHGSLLPKYRGAAPIQWSIINGEKTTGVTSMYISKGLDEGDIILQKTMEIDEKITSEELFFTMADVGADLLIETIEAIKGGNAPRIPQRETKIKPSFAPMLNKDIGKISFNAPAEKIHNLIRGVNPWPIATFNLKELKVKVFDSEVVEFDGDYTSGEVVSSKDLIVACKNKTFIKLKEVQIAGKKRVSGRDFLNGNHISLGDILK